MHASQAQVCFLRLLFERKCNYTVQDYVFILNYLQVSWLPGEY